ncbi:MAG TPA: cytochrome P450 [Actinoplanes sp.]|jgi:cytochrome P450|nr:cytochrome P450 [Actinoplanes sp.]
MRARSRDRRVYLASHPVLFALLAATRHRHALRLGGTILVHGREAFVTALTRIPLDRTAHGTTGGAAGRLTGTDMLFDQQGDAHRRTRRATADGLGATDTARLRPVWTEVLQRRLAPLARGGEVDLVDVTAELAGSTAAALIGHLADDRPACLTVDPLELAAAARAAGATAARAHLPGLGRRRADVAAEAAAARLTALIAPAGGAHASLATMLAVAAITTTVAALPRAAAWAADDDLWGYALSHPAALTDELLRVTAPTPLLPRVAAASGDLGACPVRDRDRLLLLARHAVGAHRTGPDALHPAPAQVAQLVFGAGPHACPGARLARAQMTDLLAALAPHRPTVVRARADRRAALPSWRSLVIRAAA